MINIGRNIRKLYYKYFPSFVRVDGVKIYLREESYDDYVVRTVWQEDEYWLKKITLPSTGTILDIGAHIGIFTLRANKEFPNYRIIAIEPETQNFRLLQRNVKANRLEKVQMINKAVWPFDNEVRLNIDLTNTAGHSIVNKVSSKGLLVSTINLNHVFNQYGLGKIELLKIDCEGSEYEIIFELDLEYLQKIDIIILEYHNHPKFHFPDLKNYLTNHGFTMILNKDFFIKGQGTALFKKIEKGIANGFGMGLIQISFATRHTIHSGF